MNSAHLPKSAKKIDTGNARHACNVVRRQVMDEFPHITFQFIICTNGQEMPALQARRQELEQHPAGTRLYVELEKYLTQTAPLPPCFLARQDKKYFPLPSREKILICAFIRTDLFDSIEDIRHHALILVWHGLNLLERYKVALSLLIQEQGGIITAVLDEKQSMRDNMLADTFAAVFMELQGHKAYIRNLGRRRSLMALSPHPGWWPEDYPYPLALDAAEIVYEEVIRFSERDVQPMKQALDMSREIGETFEPNAVTQWHVFARSAQEMAWAHIEKNIILGAAIHTSEDPYVRAIAYMIAEFLDIQPALSIDPSLYNPFGDPETNQRHHRKIAEDTLTGILARSALQRDSLLFREEAETSYKNLLSGRPVGWCSYPLLKAQQAYDGAGIPAEQARRAFDEAFARLPWPKIQEFHHAIMQQRREGRDLDFPGLQVLAANTPGLPDDLFDTL